MDYKYIEQLLDRYFDCLTTLEEEQILRSFFGQKDVPAHLMQYRDMFVFQSEMKGEELDEKFDARMLELISNETKTPVFSIRRQLAPFFRAAAIVAVILSVGNIAEHSISDSVEVNEENAVAIDPYIKAANIGAAVQIKDVSRAEATTPDSMLNIQIQTENEDAVQ